MIKHISRYFDGFIHIMVIFVIQFMFTILIIFEIGVDMTLFETNKALCS